MLRADELAMAAGHVRDGEHRVLEQEVLVRKLAAAGYPCEQATELLVTFRITVDLMKQHLDLIEKEIEAEKTPRALAMTWAAR